MEGPRHKLDRTVAVKVPRKNQLEETEAEQFLREARAAAQLRHPNIVAVHEVGRYDGQIYIVSDFIEGLPLSSWLTARQLNAHESAELCAKIAVALSHAHTAGIVHRDLKPSNVILDNDGEPHLMDFGLCKREAGEITVTLDGKILGTPAYMSPEQAKGESHAADRRTDIYSLGVILYELMTGERPFRGDFRMLLHQVIHDEPPSPRSLRQSLPRDLETICLKAMDKIPDRRYATAGELSEDLTRFLCNEPIKARRIGSIGRTMRWCRRNPAHAALVALSVVGFILVSVLLSSLAYSQRLANSRDRLQVANTTLETANQRIAEAKADVEDLLYAQNVLRAFSEWKAGRLNTATSLLSDCPVEARDWEWFYVDGLCHSHLRSKNELQRLEAVRYDPNKPLFAVGRNDGVVILVDAVSFTEQSRLEGHVDEVDGIAFSLDGRWIATAGWEGVAKIWHAGTGELWKTLEGHQSYVTDVAFSPDGRLLATAGWDNVAKLWDVNTGAFIVDLSGHTNNVKGVAFSSDGRYLATAGWDNVAKLWEVDGHKFIRDFLGHRQGLIRVNFSPDGGRLVTASEDTTAKIWDVYAASDRSDRLVR